MLRIQEQGCAYVNPILFEKKSCMAVWARSEEEKKYVLAYITV